MNLQRPLISALLIAALDLGSVAFAATDHASAEANRKKPLQRCDQLKGDAEVDCLNTARERIVEARKKREAEAGKGGKSGSTQK